MATIWLSLKTTFIFISVLVILSISTEVVGRDRYVNKTLIEAMVKRFQKPQNATSIKDKVEELLNCVEGHENVCDSEKRKLVVNEVILRSIMSDRNRPCTVDLTNYTLIYDPPSLDYKYKPWQDILIDSGKIFCDPFKHLYCSPTKICECRPGTVWNSTIDSCSTKYGGYCFPSGIIPRHSRYSPPQLFDPFQLKFKEPTVNRLERQEIVNAFCSGERPLFQGYCHRLDYFLNYICVSDTPNATIFILDKRLRDHFRDLPRLNYGESCNLKLHTQLFTSPEAEWEDYTIRVKNLEAILAMPIKTHFCDHRQFLTCGMSGRCECMKPTIAYDNINKICRFKSPIIGCALRRELFIQKLLLPRIATGDLETGFDRIRPIECNGAPCLAYLVTIDGQRHTADFCRICPKKVIGKNCDKSQTRLMEGYLLPALAYDLTNDYDKQIQLFVDMNEKAKELENLFTLPNGSRCDLKIERESYRAITLIGNLEEDETVVSEKDYKNLIDSLDGLVRKGVPLCQRKIRGSAVVEDLICVLNATNSAVCTVRYYDVQLNDLLQRLYGDSFQILQKGQTCGPDVKEMVEVARRTRYFDKSSYKYALVPLEMVYANNTKFCNRTAGLRCAFCGDVFRKTGKCVFSGILYKEVLAEQEAERKKNEKNSSDLSISPFSINLILVSFIFLLINTLL